MSFEMLKTFSRSRIARAGVGILVLAGAAFAEYRLANVRLPVNVETIKNFFPATIRLGQELVIEGPVVDPADGMLFSHDGGANEIVDVSFERARLTDETISIFESGGRKPPSTVAPIDYWHQKPKKPATGDDSCRTRVEVCAGSKMPGEIHLFQLEDPGRDLYRRVEMTASGEELISRVLIHSPSDLYLEPGCLKVLRVGDWYQASSANVAAIAAENSNLRFTFKPLTSASLWDGTERLFEPFDLGVKKVEPDDPTPFQARAVSIRALGGGNANAAPTELASARSTSDGPLLTISRLRIGSDQLQISIAGKGFVKINGEDKTVNLVKRIEENKILAGLLAAADAALLAWVARLVLKSPSSSPQPRQPRGRIRKRERRHRG